MGKLKNKRGWAALIVCVVAVGIAIALKAWPEKEAITPQWASPKVSFETDAEQVERPASLHGDRATVGGRAAELAAPPVTVVQQELGSKGMAFRVQVKRLEDGVRDVNVTALCDGEPLGGALTGEDGIAEFESSVLNVDQSYSIEIQGRKDGMKVSSWRGRIVFRPSSACEVQLKAHPTQFKLHGLVVDEFGQGRQGVKLKQVGYAGVTISDRQGRWALEGAVLDRQFSFEWWTDSGAAFFRSRSDLQLSDTLLGVGAAYDYRIQVPTDSTSITMRVVDMSTGGPIVGAAIQTQIGDHVLAHTNASGGAELLFAGSQIPGIRVCAQGYSDAYVLPKSGNTDTLEVGLTPGYFIRGQLLRLPGEQVSGVCVKYAAHGVNGARYECAWTDANGGFTAYVNPSDLPLVLWLDSEGGLLGEALVFRPLEDPVLLDCRPRGAIEGRVLSSEGEPLGRAVVSVHGLIQHGIRHSVVKSDEHGFFRIACPLGSSGTAQVRHQLGLSTELQVREGDFANIRLETRGLVDISIPPAFADRMPIDVSVFDLGTADLVGQLRVLDASKQECYVRTRVGSAVLIVYTARGGERAEVKATAR